MNTTTLKRFAQSARRKLMDQVAAKMEFVLTTDSAELREQAKQITELKKELTRTTRDQLVERVAYTWFNRLAALRFMDANDYQPTGIRVVSPAEGTILPQALNEAKQGNIPGEWKVDTQKVYGLLDGRLPASNPQNEAYHELLIAACNHLHSVFPFLFEAINDYSELLLPDDLTSDFSIVHDVATGMSADDCQQVEVLGWLYQFYISEEKDRLINAKKKYKAHEIAPVTQLFTPHWIVRYMVDNTLGQLWKEMRPNSRLTGNLEFYIKPKNESVLPLREAKSPEEITFFDPCGGSGHILTYAFDVYYKIYEEEGYNPSEIPALIISKNLFGAEIDERAAQLAGFALMMKGRQYYRRFLKKPVMPNIVAYRNVENDPLFENAKVLGSLIQVDEKYVENIKVDSTTLFGETNRQLKKQAELLAQQYDVVVTNPPYLNSSSMEPELKKYIDQNFKDTKSDLFASFVIQVSRLTKKEGLIGYISPYVWMFISSYEKLRDYIIKNMTLSSLIQLEYNAFEPACVPVCTFTLRNEFVLEYKGSYIKLSEFRGHQNQVPKTLEAIQNPDCGWFYTTSQTNFQKIPGSPIGYWINEQSLKIIDQSDSIKDYGSPRQGLITGNNNLFLKYWFEPAFHYISFNISDSSQTMHENRKWYPYIKGGEFRKFYGNQLFVVNWENDGEEIKNYKNDKGKLLSRPQNIDFYFKRSITWSRISSSFLGVRYNYEGKVFDCNSICLFIENEEYFLSLLSSKVANFYLNLISPTLTFQAGDVAKIPVVKPNDKELNNNVDTLTNFSIEISKNDWDSNEISWDFEKNELLREAGNQKSKSRNIKLEEAYKNYKKHWNVQFFQLHHNEEELNRQFIEIYGLQEELTPDVPLEEITILQQELDRKALAKLNNQLQREPGTLKVLNYPEIKLPFIAKEVMAQFVSYAVGCMFGRYSLEKPGLILANQGETLEDYWKVVQDASSFSKGGVERQRDGGFDEHSIAAESGETKYQNPPESPFNKGGRAPMNRRFIPDDDNIIPVLDDEWFEDDIVTRFKAFLKASFGEEHFDRNLQFVEECFGKDIRRYFARDFYTDHVRRYKKRPIYWLFSSPGGAFNALIYMHRYTPDTISLMLNNYLREYQEKLRARRQHLEQVQISGTSTEKTQALKETERIDKVLLELQEYERETIYPLATQRISINLDDGVLVNYNKFGKAVKTVPGLNDTKTKKKVRGFDWIDVSEIKD